MYYILGYFRPRFTIKINYRLIWSFNISIKEKLFHSISTTIHEGIHFLQFWVVAHGSIPYYRTKRYRKMTEHQAVYINAIIAKLMGMKYDQKEIVKVLWTGIDRENF